MKILLVCNRNIVRSIFAEHFLKFHYPELAFESCGLNAGQVFTPINEVANFLKKCGIPFSHGYSKNFSEVELNDFDCILFFDSVEMSHWFKLRHKNKIFFLRNFYEDPRIIPVDPLGLDSKDLEIELIKVSYGLIRFIRSIRVTLNQCHAYAIESDSLPIDLVKMDLMHFLEKFNGVVLDLSFSMQSAKYLDMFQRDSQLVAVTECLKLERTDLVYRVEGSGQHYLPFLFGPNLRIALESALQNSNIFIIGSSRSEVNSMNYYLSTYLWADLGYNLIFNTVKL